MSKLDKDKQPSCQKEQHECMQTAQNAPSQDTGSSEPAKQILVIYRSRPEEEGDFWTPQYGNVCIPDGWEFLPRGNAFVTRQVKKGPHWVLKGRYNRRGGYTPVKGIYAPSSAIEAARAAAAATEARREKIRQKSRIRREKADEKYHQEFEKACLQFLDFTPIHSDLAQEIAGGTTAWACEKHSGRVGRTDQISLMDKVTLAVRAYIRHRYTDYESSLPDFSDYFADEAYREVKADAHYDVDRFLEEHRARA